MPIDKLIDTYSTNKDRSKFSLELLQRTVGLLETVLKTNADVDAPAPIIAGGCIRDIVIGLHCNDVDIFLPDYSPLSSLFFSVRGSWSTDGESSYALDREDSQPYQVFTSWFPYKTQIILRPDVPESGTKKEVLEFLDSFDYNLVKCAYSPVDGFIFHPDFLEGLSNWSLDKDTNRTYAFNSRLPSTKRLKHINHAPAVNPPMPTQTSEMGTENATAAVYGDIPLPPIRRIQQLGEWVLSIPI